MAGFLDSIRGFVARRRLYHSLPAPTRRVLRGLGGDSVCVDCGANIGAVADLFASRGAMVYAFEPNPHAFRELAATASRHPKLKPLEKAVGTEAGSTQLFFHRNADENHIHYSQASSLMRDKPNVGSSSVEVDVEDLAAFLAWLRRVDILKMDIEGYETVLLPHLVESGALAHVRHAFVETHDHKWSDLRGATDAMLTRVAASPWAGRVSFDWP